jgi:hypothetical protein
MTRVSPDEAAGYRAAPTVPGIWHGHWKKSSEEFEIAARAGHARRQFPESRNPPKRLAPGILCMKLPHTDAGSIVLYAHRVSSCLIAEQGKPFAMDQLGLFRGQNPSRGRSVGYASRLVCDGKWICWTARPRAVAIVHVFKLLTGPRCCSLFT